MLFRSNPLLKATRQHPDNPASPSLVNSQQGRDSPVGRDSQNSPVSRNRLVLMASLKQKVRPASRAQTVVSPHSRASRAVNRAISNLLSPRRGRAVHSHWRMQQSL